MHSVPTGRFLSQVTGHRSQVTIKTLSKFRDVTITEIPERFIDVSMEQTLNKNVLLYDFNAKNFLGVVYVRNGSKYSFQTCSVNIFYRNKIIHYNSKLNCFISIFFLKSLQRVCTKQKQECPLYLL